MWGSWIAVISSILYRKPLLLRTGYEFYKFSIQQKKSNIYKTFAKFISILAYKKAHEINVTTNEDKCFIIKKFKLNKNKINIIPNWIDTDLFKPAKNNKKKSVLLVGRLENQKNYSFIIKSLYKTKIKLFIVGDGKQKKELSQLANNLNVEVIFLNNIPNDQMPKIYNQHMVYILCSKFEGNPKTLLEAMSCGCAVVGTNVPGISEIIENNINGISTELNEKKMKKIIQSLIINSDLVKKLGQNARKYILKNNSLKMLINKEYQIYVSLKNRFLLI